MTYTDRALALSPTGLFLLNEASGASGADTAGGSAATLTSIGTYRVAGPNADLPYGVRLNGSASFITLPAAAVVVDASNGITLTGWFKMNALSNWMRLFDLGSGAPGDNLILTPQDGPHGKFAVDVYNNTTDGGIVPSIVWPDTTTWHHAALSLKASGKVRLLIDGQVVGVGTTGVPRAVTRANAYVGKSNWADPLLSGDVAAVALYDRALHPTEIRELYDPTLDGPMFLGATAGSGGLGGYSHPLPPVDAGDVIAVGVLHDTDNALTTPAGYTKKAGDIRQASYMHVNAFTKDADGTETTVLATTGVSSGTACVVAAVYSECDVDDEADAFAGNVSPFTQPQVTVEATSRVVHITAAQNGVTGVGTIDQDTDVTQRASQAAGTERIVLGDFIPGAAGTSPAEGATVPSIVAPDLWIGVTLSLTPTGISVPPTAIDVPAVVIDRRAHRHRHFPPATLTETGLVYLDTLAATSSPRLTRTINGELEATWQWTAPPRLDHAGIAPGLPVQVATGPASVWQGQLDQPERDSNTLRATGRWALANRLLATADTGHANAATHVDECVDNAIADGWPVIRRQTLPNTTGFIQSGTVAMDEFLTTVADDLGKYPTVDDYGELRLEDPPTDITYLLLATDVPPPTLNDYVTTYKVAYVDDITRDVTLITVSNAAAVARFGDLQQPLDLTPRGSMSGVDATAIGTARLGKVAPRARWTDPFTVTDGQLLTVGGTAVDLGSARPFRLARLLLGDVGRSALVDLGVPSTVLIGQTEYDGSALAVYPVDTEGTRLRNLLAKIG